MTPATNKPKPQNDGTLYGFTMTIGVLRTFEGLGVPPGKSLYGTEPLLLIERKRPGKKCNFLFL